MAELSMCNRGHKAHKTGNRKFAETGLVWSTPPGNAGDPLYSSPTLRPLLSHLQWWGAHYQTRQLVPTLEVLGTGICAGTELLLL